MGRIVYLLYILNSPSISNIIDEKKVSEKWQSCNVISVNGDSAQCPVFGSFVAPEQGPLAIPDPINLLLVSWRLFALISNSIFKY